MRLALVALILGAALCAGCEDPHRTVATPIATATGTATATAALVSTPTAVTPSSSAEGAAWAADVATRNGCDTPSERPFSATARVDTVTPNPPRLGQDVVVTAEKFRAAAEVQLLIGHGEQSTRPLATGTTDQSGKVTLTFALPDISRFARMLGPDCYLLQIIAVGVDERAWVFLRSPSLPAGSAADMSRPLADERAYCENLATTFARKSGPFKLSLKPAAPRGDESITISGGNVEPGRYSLRVFGVGWPDDGFQLGLADVGADGALEATVTFRGSSQLCMYVVAVGPLGVSGSGTSPTARPFVVP